MKEIEIPFGAKDSELKGWEYTIPEGMEAEIKDGKIVVREKESEDERIINQLITLVDSTGEVLLIPTNKEELIAWLKKQKENPKSADSIPSDCVSDAKCEDKSPKHSDSDGTDIRDTPAYWKGWDDAMKQKEQKHPNGCFTCDEYKIGYEAGRLNGFTAGYNKAMKEVEQKEQKPAEWKPSEQKYDGNVDKECIKLCDILNFIPSIDTFESCCGHLKDRYSIWFFCNDIITVSRLGRCVERNYSDGKWELLVDSTDTHPTGVFWLRSKEPFQNYDEMEKSVNGLCNSIQYWFNTRFDSYFNGNSGK